MGEENWMAHCPAKQMNSGCATVIGYQVGNDVGILTDRETVVSPTRNLETERGR